MSSKRGVAMSKGLLFGECVNMNMSKCIRLNFFWHILLTHGT
jgi:hypothetical protein